MCILLTTTSHPDFPLLLLSNRDEYFARPTQWHANIVTARPRKTRTWHMDRCFFGRQALCFGQLQRRHRCSR